LPDSSGNTNGKYETVDRKILKPPCAGANKWYNTQVIDYVLFLKI
jgi:hypothetical protein